MHNIAAKHGIASRIFQFGHPSAEISVREIRDFKPDAVGLSFMGYQPEAIKGAHDLLGSFSEFPDIVIGGSDPRLNPGFYIHEFARYSGMLNGGLLLIARGRGEALITELVSSNDGELTAFFNKHARYVRVGGKYIAEFNDVPFVPVENNEVVRPYDLSVFSWNANVNWAVGCFGKCKYCNRIPWKIDYVSPESVLRELRHLRELGARHIRMASPDFTANPDKASEIISVLPVLPEGYSFESRIDSFNRAMTRHPEAWKRFANLSHNQVELGVESFIPERLVQIGKYQTLGEAKAHEGKLRDIIEFFRQTNTVVRMFLISLDWQMDLGEAEIEALKTLEVLNEFSETAYIMPDTGVGRLMAYQIGSHYSKSMRPVDYFRFSRDPRLFLLHSRIEMEKEIAINDLERGEIKENEIIMVSYAMLEYYLELINALKSVNPNSIDMNHGLEMLIRKNTYHEIVDSLINRMGLEGKKLEGVFYSDD